MPNWCMNKLTVSGPAQELKRFVEASIGFPACYPPQEWEKKADPIPDTPYFCFNALIPTPPEVLATGYSVRQNQPENAFWRAMAGESVPGRALQKPHNFTNRKTQATACIQERFPLLLLIRLVAGEERITAGMCLSKKRRKNVQIYCNRRKE